MDDIESKLDQLIEMYLSDRKATIGRASQLGGVPGAEYNSLAVQLPAAGSKGSAEEARKQIADKKADLFE